MKYILFAAASLFGIPLMTFASVTFPRVKHLLLSLLIFSLMLGDKVSINFVSMEQYRGPVRGFEVTFADLICIALFFTLIISQTRNIKWIPKAFIPALIYFIYSAATVVTSTEPIFGQFALFQLIRAGLLFWCVYNLIYTERGSREMLEAVWLGFVLVGIVIALITFKQKYIDGYFRVPAFFDHSNTIPSYLILSLCVILVWGMADKQLSLIKFAASMAASLGMLFAIFSTGSRAGYAVAAGSVVAALVVTNFRKRRVAGIGLFRIRLATAVISISVLIGGAMVIDTVIERFREAPEASATAREEFNIAAEMMASDYLTGVGLNQYSRVLTYQEEYRDHFVVMANELQGGVAHHIFLLTAAELGYPGLIIFIVLLLRIFFAVLARGLRWRTFHQLLLLGTAAGLGAFYALGFLEWVFRQTPVLYQFVITAAFGLSLAALDKEGYLQEEGIEDTDLPDDARQDDELPYAIEAENKKMKTALQHYTLKENSR